MGSCCGSKTVPEVKIELKPKQQSSLLKIQSQPIENVIVEKHETVVTEHFVSYKPAKDDPVDAIIAEIINKHHV